LLAPRSPELGLVADGPDMVTAPLGALGDDHESQTAVTR
jgi:hypothetical protein